MIDYEKPYLFLLEAVNEVINNIDSTDTDTIKEYLLIIKNIAEDKLNQEKKLKPHRFGGVFILIVLF